MKKLSYIFFVCAFFMACETVVEVDVPREAPKLVANAFINPDSLISVRVSKSKFVLDNAPLRTVDHANVSIFENDELKEQLAFLGEGLYSASFKPSEGKAYTLRIAADGFESIEATTFIKNPVPIQEIQYDTISEEAGSSCIGDDCTIFYYTNFKLNLKLNDPADEENFYEVEVFKKGIQVIYNYDSVGNYYPVDSIIYYQPVYLSSEDPAVSDLEFEFEGEGYYGETLLFSDEIFNGKSYMLNFKTNDYSTDTEELIVTLKSLDEARYRYLRSKELQNWNEGNPFAEPVNVYNNIENGYGIFGGYSSDIYILNIE